MEILENVTSTKFIEKISTYVFNVRVNSKASWQSTGIEVKEGELLQIQWVGGTWKGDTGQPNHPYHGPDGPKVDAYLAPANYPMPGVMEDSLVGRIGNLIFSVGQSHRSINKASGILSFTINDIGYQDNDGELIMEVTIGRAI